MGTFADTNLMRSLCDIIIVGVDYQLPAALF